MVLVRSGLWGPELYGSHSSRYNGGQNLALTLGLLKELAVVGSEAGEDLEARCWCSKSWEVYRQGTIQYSRYMFVGGIVNVC